MLDLAVVGSGPCALALVSRLACAELADTSLDYLFGFDSATEPLADTVQRLAALRKTSTTHLLKGRVKVFDASGSWMGKWNGLFASLGIKHLRSPHVAHPSPTHALALLAHAEALPQVMEMHLRVHNQRTNTVNDLPLPPNNITHHRRRRTGPSRTSPSSATTAATARPPQRSSARCAPTWSTPSNSTPSSRRPPW